MPDCLGGNLGLFRDFDVSVTFCIGHLSHLLSVISYKKRLDYWLPSSLVFHVKHLGTGGRGHQTINEKSMGDTMGTKVHYLGAMHCKGIGKNGAYDFCQVKYMNQIQPVQSEKRSVVAYGAEEATVDLDPSAIHAFANLKPGQLVELDIGPNPRNLQRNLCTGVINAEAKAS